MKKSLAVGIGTVVLALSVALVVWQGSFSLGHFDPVNVQQTFMYWEAFLLIFVLMVTLGFILFRELVKLYIARQANQEGSRIRTKLVLGALTLTCVPAFFLVLFSFDVLSHSMNRWFTNPVEHQLNRFLEIAQLLQKEMGDEIKAQTALLAEKTETHQILVDGIPTPGFLERFAKAQESEAAALFPATGNTPVDTWGPW